MLRLALSRLLTGSCIWLITFQQMICIFAIMARALTASLSPWQGLAIGLAAVADSHLGAKLLFSTFFPWHLLEHPTSIKQRAAENYDTSGMDAGTGNDASRPRRRAPRACQFCRLRKVRSRVSPPRGASLTGTAEMRQHRSAMCKLHKL